MKLSEGAMIGILAVGIAALVLGKTLASGRKPVEKDESINDDHNISGGRSRRNRQVKNKSRRR